MGHAHQIPMEPKTLQSPMAKCHTQDQIGEGGNHEVFHQADTSQDAICHPAAGDYKVETGRESAGTGRTRV